MILFRHELRQGWRSLILWTAAIAGFMALISLLFPQVKDQMASINGLITWANALIAFQVRSPTRVVRRLDVSHC